jgi:aspartyl aminopeptidase
MFYQDNSVENNVGETEKKESNITAPTVNELSQMFQDMEVSEDENKELSPGKALEERLQNKSQHLFDVYDKETTISAFSFAEDYRIFLDKSKTEREVVLNGIDLLKNVGFVDIADKETLTAGDRVYKSIRGKGLVAAVVGEASIKDGFNILGAHLDSPRLDIKPNPLYEEGEMTFLKTHYYGGIKKYQWTTIPLALHGTVVRKDGTTLNFTVGEDENDPVFALTDLLIHLGKDQMQKTAAKVVEGEEMNILVGGRPVPHKDVSNRFKLAILQILKERYDISERDLLSAEISAVPAGKTRDLGFDRSFLAGYGHDDRVCAYPAVRAIATMQPGEKTGLMLLTDKEEVGSQGNTGAQSQSYENFMMEIYAKKEGAYDVLGFHQALENSSMLSTDVTVGFDPNFPSTVDPKNVCYMGHGVALTKYTGHGGKGGANDASAEFFSKVAHLLDEHKVPWQTGELGKVDQGGGGTIALYYANRGMQVIDSGVPVLNMHAPGEVIHKLDLYSTYQAYKAFIENM